MSELILQFKNQNKTLEDMTSRQPLTSRMHLPFFAEGTVYPQWVEKCKDSLLKETKFLMKCHLRTETNFDKAGFSLDINYLAKINIKF